jgi:hypothetical protein
LSGVAGADVIFTGLGRGDFGGLLLVDFTGLTGSVAGARELSRKIIFVQNLFSISVSNFQVLQSHLHLLFDLRC